MKTIQLRDVHYHVGKSVILPSIRLELPCHQFIAVIGPNGAGKSHFLKCIAGLIDFAGTIEIAGINLMYLSVLKRAQHLSWLGQSPDIEFNYSLKECVLMGRFARHQGFPTSDDHARVMEELQFWGILHLADRGMHSLSQGERQRAFLARTFVADTDFVLLDEPDHNLDVKAKLLLFKKIDSVCGQGKTVIAVLHSLYDVFEHADWTVMLKDGDVMSSGTNSEVLTSQNLTRLLDVEVKLGSTTNGLPGWMHFSELT